MNCCECKHNAFIAGEPHVCYKGHRATVVYFDKDGHYLEHAMTESVCGKNPNTRECADFEKKVCR
jgi:hypothetical protein